MDKNYGKRPPNRDGSSSQRGAKASDQLGEIENSRIVKVINLLLNHHSSRHSLASLAAVLGVTEQVMRQYVKGQKARYKSDEDLAKELENKWGLPVGILAPNCAPERFDAFLHELHGRSIRRRSGWLYTSFWQERDEEALERGHIAIVLSPDCYNDGERAYTHYMVTQNALKGVEYRYIVPNGAPQREKLDRLVKIIGEEVVKRGKGTVPRVHERGKNTDAFWSQTTHICLFLNETSWKPILEDFILKIGNKTFLPFIAVRELYLHNDKFSYMPTNPDLSEFCWSTIPSRELRSYVSLINSWKIN